MAHFYGGVQGHRGEATRLGSKSAGLSSFSNGWHIGADVRLSHYDGVDSIVISLTHGSNGGRSEVFTVRFAENELDDAEAIAGRLREAAQSLFPLGKRKPSPDEQERALGGFNRSEVVA